MSGHETTHERLTRSVIAAFFEVYNNLDFGYFEQLYLAALSIELRTRGHAVAREVSVRVLYKGTAIGWQRLDMVVDRTLVVEVKSTVTLHPIAYRQLQSYLCSTSLDHGLLLHFGPKPQFYRLSARGKPGSPDERSNG